MASSNQNIVGRTVSLNTFDRRFGTIGAPPFWNPISGICPMMFASQDPSLSMKSTLPFVASVLDVLLALMVSILNATSCLRLFSVIS